jgi:hypothetical protein
MNVNRKKRRGKKWNDLGSDLVRPASSTILKADAQQKEHGLERKKQMGEIIHREA